MSDIQLPQSMHATVMQQYGDANLLEYVELPIPTPKSNQLLIKNLASSVNPIDWKIRRGMFRYVMPLRFPKILGFDYCGQVVAIGKRCKTFKPGDWVFGMSDQNGGCNAEYICVGERTAVRKPDELSALQAATIPAASLTAWQGLYHHAHLCGLADVLIIGATGGVGLAAVQVALALGAKVTVLASPRNFPLLKELGVTTCIDYHGYDFEQHSQTKFDIIFDTAAVSPFQALKQLKPNGTFVTTVPTLSLFAAKLKTMFSHQHVGFVMVKSVADDLAVLTRFVAQKQLKPIIFQTFSLKNLAAAQRLSEEGHAVGKIAISIPSTDEF